MKIFPAETVKKIDQYTIKNESITSIDLMERAALKLKDWYIRRYRTDRKVVVLAGPGDNGGDALALARMLAERQYRIECYLVGESGKVSNDCGVNLERLKRQGLVRIHNIRSPESFPSIEKGEVVIDGLFGSGLTRVVEGVYRNLIMYVNNCAATVISVDIPSGLFGEDNSGNDPDAIIKADFTLTFQFPFLSFFFAENGKYTGQWEVLNIGLHPEIIQNTGTTYKMSDRKLVARILPVRDKFAHKGTFGHALIIAGSSGMMGTALLAGGSALRSGAGLVTLHIPETGFRIIQTALPEAIVSLDSQKDFFSIPPDTMKYSAVAAGPGLGMEECSVRGLRKLLEQVKIPVVIDADALNMIAANPDLIHIIPEKSILTPHPLEFERIAGESPDSWSRHLKQIEFSVRNKVVIILKGGYTGISFPDGTYIFNSTGNPGMATGGSGDVLTGIIVSLLAQGLSPEDSAIAGVYLHGLAGDLAAGKFSQESMIAGDITNCLGDAFKKVKEKLFLHEGRLDDVVQ